MQHITGPEPTDPETRPPQPLGLDNDDVLYDEPHASTAPTASTQGPSSDNKMRNRPDIKPPESAAAASTIPLTTSLPAEEEEEGEYGEPSLSPEYLQPSDISEKEGKSQHRRHSGDNTNATTPLKNRLAKTPSSPLSKVRSSLDANMLQPAASESQQCGTHHERSNSVVLEHVYLECIP